MNRLTALVLVLFLTGCAEFAAFSSGFRKHASDVTDQAINTNIYVLCEGSTIGSIKRKFNTPDKIKLYNDFCGFSD